MQVTSNDNKFRVSQASEYIGMALSDTIRDIPDNIFYSLVPIAVRPFYDKVRYWDCWINGIVPQFHNLNNGVIPTGLAKSIVNKVANLLYGGGIILNPYGATETDSNALAVASQWCELSGIQKQIQKAFIEMVGLGTSCIKLNIDENGVVYPEARAFNQSYLQFNEKGEVIAAKFFVNILDANWKDKSGNVYCLVEDRYYKTKNNGTEKIRLPICKYGFYMQSKTHSNTVQGGNPIKWEDLPTSIKDIYRQSYGSYKLDTETIIPLLDIGVFPFTYTTMVSSNPSLKYGESVLANNSKYLCQYDILSAELDTEMYIGRGRVIASKSISSQKNINFNSGVDSFLITEVPTMDVNGKPIEFIQPQIRAEELRNIRNQLLENISTAVGLSPSTFASYLQDGSNRTAREISAEENATTLLIQNKRDIYCKTLQSLFADVLYSFGIPATVSVSFSKAGQTNYTLLVENATRIYQAGGMSLERYVRTINPEMSEQEVQEEIARIKAEQSQKQAEQYNSLFGDMEQTEEIIS